MELHAIGFKKSGKKKRELENFSQLFKISVLLGLIVHLWLHMGRARSFWKVVGDSSKVIMSPWSEQGEVGDISTLGDPPPQQYSIR